MELRSNYLPTTVSADNAHNGPLITLPTVDTSNTYNDPPAAVSTGSLPVAPFFTTTHSNPLNGFVTGDHKDVS